MNLLSRCVGGVGSFGGRICVMAFETPNANLPANSFGLSAALLIKFLPVFVVVVWEFCRFGFDMLLIASVCGVVGCSLPCFS